MVSKRNPSSMSVCVVGAGPAGLVAARELRKEGHNVVVIEQSHDIGGQWLYDSRFDGSSSVHSSIYSSLRLTSPREIMGFTDFPFVAKTGRDTRRFPGHKELLLYLQDFCERFSLGEMIRFKTRVERVEMMEKGSGKWVVKSKAEKVVEEVYDAVVVATGHYSQPRLPTIKGMDAWRRKHMHSQLYRTPEPFRNKAVVVIGNSLSGQDISVELVSVAKAIHLSAKSLDISQALSNVISKYDNLHIHPLVESLHEDGRVLFADGSWIIADTIIYCTGYSYSFPFLDTKGIVTIDDNRVGPLYEHTFPPSLAPSLSFIGIPRKIIGFPFFECQAKWIAQVLSGKRVLPSRDEMVKSVEEFYESRDVAGIPKRNTHDIACFDYCDKYGDIVGFPRTEEWRKELCLSSLRRSEINLETYRDFYEEDQETLRVAYSSPHFNQLGRGLYPFHFHGIRACLILRPGSSSPIAISMAPEAIPQFMNQVATTRLTENKYTIWKHQIITALRGYEIMKFIDGSVDLPPETIVDECGNMISNPAHHYWIRQDQLIVFWLLSSLSDSILASTVGLESSYDIWKTLESNFSNQSRAKILQLKEELQNGKKLSSKSMKEYLNKVKSM